MRSSGVWPGIWVLRGDYPARWAPVRAVAHVKTWRMLSEEGGCFRPPIERFPEETSRRTSIRVSVLTFIREMQIDDFAFAASVLTYRARLSSAIFSTSGDPFPVLRSRAKNAKVVAIHITRAFRDGR